MGLWIASDCVTLFGHEREILCRVHCEMFNKLAMGLEKVRRVVITLQFSELSCETLIYFFG